MPSERLSSKVSKLFITTGSPLRVTRASRSLLVTHGFSTTVRDVLKRGITDRGNTDIFIIGSGKHGSLDSKMMCNCLVELADSERFRNVTVGDEQCLLSFLDNTTHVMFVLGAECFDGKGRALHPRGLRMGGLRTRLANKKVTWPSRPRGSSAIATSWLCRGPTGII